MSSSNILREPEGSWQIFMMSLACVNQERWNLLTLGAV